MGLFVGEPAQEIDVTVSTSLSELWVVETGGCSPSKYLRVEIQDSLYLWI